MPKSAIMCPLSYLCRFLVWQRVVRRKNACLPFLSLLRQQPKFARLTLRYVVISMNRVTPTYTPTYHNPELITYNRGPQNSNADFAKPLCVVGPNESCISGCLQLGL